MTYLVKLRENGSTLIEVLAAFTVLTLLILFARSRFQSPRRHHTYIAAKNYVGGLNRAQQSYFLEHEVFIDSIKDLTHQAGGQPATEIYHYSVTVQPNYPYPPSPSRPSHVAVFHYGILSKEADGRSGDRENIPRTYDYRSVVGAVFILPIASPSSGSSQSPQEPTYATQAILCEFLLQQPNPKMANPFLKDGQPVCGEGTRWLRGTTWPN